MSSAREMYCHSGEPCQNYVTKPATSDSRIYVWLVADVPLVSIFREQCPGHVLAGGSVFIQIVHSGASLVYAPSERTLQDTLTWLTRLLPDSRWLTSFVDESLLVQRESFFQKSEKLHIEAK